ncbi:putative bifunctional diguanylate cyclase/phosphodiesterase [Pseudoduganella sp. UC29_106]|uniref:putative bifunctional diguanylate cyclase/phosphodiesterase n=1 Tax=Pseudoduganella sp. UC29_106 TaxID=3374553 RepID=UPI003756AE20
MTHFADAPSADLAGSALIADQTRKLMRVQRALRTLGDGNHTLLHAADEQQLLRDMCRVIVETGGYRVACIGYAEHDEYQTVQWMESVGIEKERLDALHYSWTDRGVGRAAPGTAIRTGKPIVGADLLTDPTYAFWREDAIRLGCSSGAAFPLLVEGEVLGVLAMAAAEPDAFDEEEVQLLGKLAADLAYGIANLRVREKHREAEATIARLAYYDGLTGLPNRMFLLERLEESMQTAKHQHQALALLHLYVGRFHEINEVLGYRSGNQLLQELGRRLQLSATVNETLAHVGEAEFALLVPAANAERAAQRAQRLAGILHDPVEVSGLRIDASVSIGIALFPGHATTAEVLLHKASAAVREARTTRGGYAVYTGGREELYTRRLALMGDLRHAIEHNQLLLYCQPKVDIASRRVCGAEALVRWEHPVHGMISTSEFIPLAEQAGLITPLTEWVMEAAFSQCYAWHEEGSEWPLAVNVSAHDLRGSDLVERVRGLFSTWGIPPELIQFELTESALMEDPASALERLRDLKQLDVQLCIDDFGTGYSSLGYLQKLPVDYIKIDQSFVMPMTVSNDSAIIVRSTIELGHNLNMKIVAEGVESQAHWDSLAALGCDLAQGFHIGKPMPASRFQNWETNWASDANLSVDDHLSMSTSPSKH